MRNQSRYNELMDTLSGEDLSALALDVFLIDLYGGAMVGEITDEMRTGRWGVDRHDPNIFVKR